MYIPYVTVEEYKESYSDIPDDNNIEKSLKKASRHIDTLTFNRIQGIDLIILQISKEIIKEVCCELATFEYENEDVITSVLSSYSINGVSMAFGDSWMLR